MNMIDSDLDDTKRRLWENLNKKNSVDVRDNSSLHRLLTFVEMPSFIKERNKIFLPEIKVGSSLVSQNTNISKSKSILRRSTFLPSENTLQRNKTRLEHGELQSILNSEIIINDEKGFMPISPEIAVSLRQLTYGSLRNSFSEDWRSAYFSFKNVSEPLGYCLYSEKNVSRGFQVCIQAYFLKNLLYSTDVSNNSRSRFLNVTESRRLDCLIRTLTEILWKVGDHRVAFVCLLSNENYVDPSHFYRCDKITEKINIFKFKSMELLLNFIRKHISEFTTRNSNGCILFLYSIVLSKGLQEVFEDLDFDVERSLLTNIETLSQSAINLIITGHATEHLINGTQHYDQFNNYLFSPLRGIKQRSDIGYLQYNTPEDTDYLTNATSGGRRASDTQTVSKSDIEQLNVVGSMLKTPKYPIWIISANGNMGVLFGLRDDLLSHWRAENQFQLNYLNVLPTQREVCILSITTRRGRTAKFKTAIVQREENKRIPLLNHVINTKWFGCRIDWNNSTPFI